jgi:hypothetical protein
VSTAPKAVICRGVELKPARTYKVTMHYQAGNGHMITRAMVAKFMTLESASNSYVFSLRPAAGTQHVPVDWVIGIERMDGGTPVKLPYKP